MANFLKKLFGAKSGNQGTMRLSSEPDLTIARANHEMAILTQSARDLWGLHTADWNADLASGVITFANTEMGLIVTAPLQVVGTYDTQDRTWLWGWDHSSVAEPLGEHARRVHDFGERYKLEALTTRKIVASKDDAWGFTALDCHLGGGQGGYGGSSGDIRVFTTYGAVTIRNVDPDHSTGNAPERRRDQGTA